MILRILWLFILVFLVMIVVGIIRGKGRTRSGGSKQRQQQMLLSVDYGGRIRRYEENGDHDGVSWEEYIYACYMTGKRVQGIDLKKAVAFQTTCDMRNIRSEDAMRNLLKYDEIYGDIGDTDVKKLYRIGRMLSDMVERDKKGKQDEGVPEEDDA